MANSADPDQLASSDLHCLQKQGISGFSRTRVNTFLYMHENICCGYSSEAPCQGVSNQCPKYVEATLRQFLSVTEYVFVEKFRKEKKIRILVCLKLCISNSILITHFYLTKLTHLSLASHKRNIGKQCSPRSDAAECGI